MKRYLLLLLLFTLCQSYPSQGQYMSWSRADAAFASRDYALAAELYAEVYDRKPGYTVARRVADCYYLLSQYDEALPWQERVVRYSSHTPSDELRHLELLLANRRYADVKTLSRRYVSLAMDDLDLMQRSADSALHWQANPKLVGVTWLMETPSSDTELLDSLIIYAPRSGDDEAPAERDVLNGAGSDWGLSKWGSDKYVYSSNSRDTTRTLLGAVNRGQLQLYVSRNGEASTPLFGKEERHAEEVNQGGACFSADGKEVFYSASHVVQPERESVFDYLKGDTVSMRLGIYYRTYDGSRWSAPMAFEYNNESLYSVGDPWLSPDGKRLYFSSDMPLGNGKTNIFYAERNPDGTFDYPIGLDTTVNRAGYSSRFPRFDPQGNFYFTSNGFPGMGGLDIFKIAVEDGKWDTRTQNMGYPFNSPQDDFAPYFVSETRGYLSSNRFDGRGSDDIYAFDLHPIQELSFAPILAEPEPEPEEELGIEEIRVAETITLKNIYYDLDRWEVRSDATPELKKLAALLRKHPGMVIEVSSHTDVRGSAKYNQTLSQMRATAVKQYLVTQGIESERVVAKGYGASRLKVQCGGLRRCTEADHQTNRRTEFTILELGSSSDLPEGEGEASTEEVEQPQAENNE